MSSHLLLDTHCYLPTCVKRQNHDRHATITHPVPKSNKSHSSIIGEIDHTGTPTRKTEIQQSTRNPDSIHHTQTLSKYHREIYSPRLDSSTKIASTVLLPPRSNQFKHFVLGPFSLSPLFSSSVYTPCPHFSYLYAPYGILK